MRRELLLAAGPGELRAVLVEDGRAVELRVERAGGGSRIGDVVLGRVLRLLPALPGALVEIGAGRPALLSAEDATDAATPETRGRGIAAWLTEGQPILVQVTRDAQGEKAVGTTLRLRLAGRLLTLTPTRPRLALPRRTAPEQRPPLEAALAPLLEAGIGAVVEEAGLGADPAALAEEAAALGRRWQALAERARGAEPPALLEAAETPLARLLAGLLDEPPERIVLDDRAAFAAARHWLARQRPALLDRLACEADGEDIFERHGVAGDLAAATARRVALPGGGALIVETTAAMSVIDVDGGAAVGGRGAAARAVLAANLAAALEAARQIRLRNLAGAIAVDFISMRARADRERVLAAFAAALGHDPARPELLGWTRLGHVELTRRRRRPPLAEILGEPPGAELVPSALTTALTALRAAAREAAHAPGRALHLRLHPDVAAALTGPAAAARRELEARLGRPLALEADPALPRAGFDIFAPDPIS